MAWVATINRRPAVIGALAAVEEVRAFDKAGEGPRTGSSAAKPRSALFSPRSFPGPMLLRVE